MHGALHALCIILVNPTHMPYENAPLGLRQRQTRVGADDKTVLCCFEFDVLRIRVRWPPSGDTCVDPGCEGVRGRSYSIFGNHFQSGFDVYVSPLLSLRLVMPHSAASYS